MEAAFEPQQFEGAARKTAQPETHCAFTQKNPAGIGA
jgi:hypothetical protein